MFGPVVAAMLPAWTRLCGLRATMTKIDVEAEQIYAGGRAGGRDCSMLETDWINHIFARIVKLRFALSS